MLKIISSSDPGGKCLSINFKNLVPNNNNNNNAPKNNNIYILIKKKFVGVISIFKHKY